MLGDLGEELPGIRGYRYYGRARELPGVKEHLRPAEIEEQGASAKVQKYQRFQNQSGAYLGDHDEDDGLLFAEEDESEQRGWSTGWARIEEAMGVDGTTSPAPPIPRPAPAPLLHGATEVPSEDTGASDTLSQRARFLPALDAEELVMPATVTRKGIEAFMLQAKKAALRSECVYAKY